MNNFFGNLNGWQRIYAVLVVFFYLPLLIAITVNVYVEPTSSKVIQEKLETELAKKKINIEIAVLSEEEFSNKPTKLSQVLKLEEKEKTHDRIEVQGSNYYWKYFLEIKKETDDKLQLEVSKILFQKIEQEFREKFLFEIIEIFGIGITIVFFIYMFGYAIGWIVKGFKQSKG